MSDQMTAVDFAADFAEIVEAYKASSDPGKIRQMATAFRKFQDDLEAVLREDAPPAEVRKGAQSKQFMMQILPTVQAYMRQFPKGHKFRILDVGPGTGHGAQLLASLYQTMELGYRAQVETTDITRTNFPYMQVFCRYVIPHIKDVHDIDDAFDIVIASHVIEHVPDWGPFAQRLKELSKGIVIICAPYKENPELLTHGHVNIIDDDFINALGPISVEKVQSPAWGQFMEPRYEMFIAVLPGMATSRL
jgi:SAM-dependent methyltransferase